MILQDVNKKSGKESIMSTNDYSDAVYNFLLSQKLTALLGNFPEASIQICVKCSLLACLTGIVIFKAR